MEITIILTTLVASIFATNSPDLCHEVHLQADGSPSSGFCQWTGPDVPVWDADVCCDIDDDGAACSVPSADGRCSTGLDRYYCEHGEALATGGFSCYQSFPSMCDAGLCIDAPEAPPPVVANWACCSAGGACQSISALMEDWDMCEGNGGEVLHCMEGVEYIDGTMDCWS